MAKTKSKDDIFSRMQSDDIDKIISDLYAKQNAEDLAEPKPFPRVIELANYFAKDVSLSQSPLYKQAESLGGYVLTFKDEDWLAVSTCTVRKKSKAFRHKYDFYEIKDGKLNPNSYCTFFIMTERKNNTDKPKIKDMIFIRNDGQLGELTCQFSNGNSYDKKVILEMAIKYIFPDPLYSICLRNQISRTEAKKYSLRNQVLAQKSEKVQDR